MDIHRLLHSSCCFLNTNTVITQQLIRTARTLEAEWWQVCGEAWIRGTKEVESSTRRVWAARFYHVTARSGLARVLKLMNRLFLRFSWFFSRSSKARVTETADTGVRLYLEILDCGTPENKYVGNCLTQLGGGCLSISSVLSSLYNLHNYISKIFRYKISNFRRRHV